MPTNEFPSEMFPHWEDMGRPETPIEALMRAAPGDEPEVSKLERLALRDVLLDAMSCLTPREAWVFNTTLHGHSLRSLGLPKTTVARIRDRAIQKLQERLQDHPVIREYLDPTHTHPEEQQ